MNPAISITVRPSAGVHIGDAAAEAVALATKLGCWVNFKFNEVDCNAAPGSDPTDLVNAFQDAREGTSRYPMAFAHSK